MTRPVFPPASALPLPVALLLLPTVLFGGCDGGSPNPAVADAAAGAEDATATAKDDSAATGAEAGSPGGQDGAGVTADASPTDHFSFFVTSMASMQTLSGSQNGFGGDLRFGKADGLSGADEICRRIAETSMPGSSSKTWRAFLSVTKGTDGQPVNAIDRVGNGPWYDRLGRLVAAAKADLAQKRPLGADTAIINDLPNENGVPNHAPDGTQVDNHDTLTGSDATGKLYSTDWSHTCHDWTSAVGSDGQPRVGHTWPRGFGGGGGGGGVGGPFGGGPGGDIDNWMSSLDEAGCAAGINIVETGPPNPSNPTVGSGGGYGGIYCFALTL